MSNNEPPQIDLTGCHYDALETALTNHLNIKVILVKGWQIPESYYTASANRDFARMGYGTQQAADKAQADFRKEESNMLGALRSNIAARDPFVGSELSENDLRSLQSLGHVTLRHGNTEPEQAVLIFDPGQNLDKEANPVLTQLLCGSLASGCFENAWRTLDEDKKISDLPIAKFVENFDISAEDMRVYQATTHVRYALQNQSEYNNKGKGWYYQPYFYNFAGLAKTDDSAGIWKGNSGMPYDKLVDKLKMEPYMGMDKLGIKDPEFFDKLRMADAIMNLQWHSSVPFDTFARFDRSDVTPQKIVDIQEDLSKKLDAKFKKYRKPGQKYDFGMDSQGLSDWRILFPVFREVYAEDKSTGAQRLYLDTIMAGLQKWFPTLTNGPVPELDLNKEPPRELHGTPPAAPAPAPAKKKHPSAVL